MSLEGITCVTSFAHSVRALQCIVDEGGDLTSAKTHAKLLGRHIGHAMTPDTAHHFSGIVETMRGSLQAAFLHGVENFLAAAEAASHPLANAIKDDVFTRLDARWQPVIR